MNPATIIENAATSETTELVEQATNIVSEEGLSLMEGLGIGAGAIVLALAALAYFLNN